MKKLMEELIEEILLRLPPNEPAHLVRTALVCKLWCRILSDSGFHRRYRAFHRTPPLLGYLHNLCYNPIPRFVRTSPVSPFITPPPLGLSTSWQALDCRHGRVLLVRFLDDPDVLHLIVWDPVTGDQHQLISMPVVNPNGLYYNGAVLCAKDDDGCDHLDCHGGPFIVVFIVSGVDHVVRASMYSSETHAWGAPSSVDVHVNNALDDRPSLLAQGALHFTLVCGGGGSERSVVIKYDLRGGHRMSVIDTPGGGFTDLVMVNSEDGGLGFVAVSDGCVYLWTRQQGGGAAAGWVRHKAAEIKTLLPPEGGYRSKPRDVIGFAETPESTGTIFINRTAGVLAVDLKSRKARMVGERGPYHAILPYTSFYTPDIAKGRLTPP